MSMSTVQSVNGHRNCISIVKDGRGIDRPRAQAAVKDLLEALGVDLTVPALRDTPRRVAAMYEELLTPKEFNTTTFPNDDGYDEHEPP